MLFKHNKNKNSTETCRFTATAHLMQGGLSACCASWGMSAHAVHPRHAHSIHSSPASPQDSPLASPAA